MNYVNWFDAARYANWLHHGPRIDGTVFRNLQLGAYDFTGTSEIPDNAATVTRSPNARFFIPTENEWYKAAYHKNDGASGNYWDYPTGSNTAPINTLSDLGNHANFYDYYGTGNNTYTIDSPYYRSEVGAFENSASPYGTFDQGGNV